MEKTKTYVITLSHFFPTTHRRAGQPTNFRAAMIAGQTSARCKKSNPAMCMGECSTGLSKLHTIRANYPLWEKRVKKIQAGHAVISVRQWSGKPYRSKQVEIARLTADDGVGIQKLCFDKDKDGVPSFRYPDINGKYIDRETLANNDGLSKEDWQEWFMGYDLSKSMAVIHFTKFRY